VQTRKPSELVSPSGLLRLAAHTAMGVAMGLAFAFLLILMDLSGIGTLIDHGGTQATTQFVSTLVLIFSVGTTLTGVVFILMEDDR
jgi:hypothetical protein